MRDSGGLAEVHCLPFSCVTDITEIYINKMTNLNSQRRVLCVRVSLMENKSHKRSEREAATELASLVFFHA